MQPFSARPKMLSVHQLLRPATQCDRGAALFGAKIEYLYRYSQFPCHPASFISSAKIMDSKRRISSTPNSVSSASRRLKS